MSVTLWHPEDVIGGEQPLLHQVGPFLAMWGALAPDRGPGTPVRPFGSHVGDECHCVASEEQR